MKKWIAFLFVAFLCDASMATIEAKAQSTFDTLWIKQQGTSVYVKNVIKTDYKLLPTTLGTGTPSATTYLTGAKTWVTMPVAKRLENYTGTTDGSGNVTITFSSAFATAPVTIPSIPNQANTNEYIRTVSTSTTSCVVNVYGFQQLLGVLQLGTTGVSSRAIRLTVLEN